MGKGKIQDTRKNAIIEITKETVQNKIYTVRGQQVMLDSDLAEIYGYTTRTFNQQIRNNLEKWLNFVAPKLIFRSRGTEILTPVKKHIRLPQAPLPGDSPANSKQF